MVESTREPEVGSELNPVTKIAKNTARGRGIHDDARARALGFKEAPVPGVTSLAYVMEVLLNFFGESWTNGGNISLTFTNPLYEGQRVTARAKVRDRKVEDGGIRLFLEVWAENEEGTKVAEGMASGLLPSVDSL